MKKIILSALLGLIILQGFSQERAYQKGESVVSLGYGIGNIWKNFLKEAISFPKDYSVSSKGPGVFIYDYNIHKRISAGIAIGYSEIHGEYNGTGSSFTEKLTAFSALARANYHFGKFKRFDPYVGGGIGYYHFKYSNSRNILVLERVPGSFGYSAQLGARYYFTSFLGIYAEAGYVGGSLGQAGAVVNF